MRLISSHVFQPTSPIHSSFVPGRNVNAERVPQPVRDDACARGVAGRRAGCRAAPRPSSDRCAGSSRRASRIAASVAGAGSNAGGPGCAARRPRRGALTLVAARAGRIAARVLRLSVVDEGEAGAVAAAHVERAVRAERERADRVARELLAPVADQHLLAAGHHVADRGESGEPAGHDAAVGRRTRRRRAAVGPPGTGRRAADRGVVRVEHVDVRRSPGSSGGAPSRAGRGPRSCGRCVRRSANSRRRRVRQRSRTP